MTGTLSLSPQHAPLPTDLRPTLIRVNGVNMTRNGRSVLHNIDFSVARNDFFAITGPNGGGKTTLMRILLGLLRPTSGTVEFPQGKLRTSYLPQKSRVDSSYPITVTETIASGLLGMKGIPRAESRQRVAQAIAQVELEAHATKPFGALSGGQQQRVLLARAIVSRPQLLVLDEPLSYIDKQFEQKIYSIIEALKPHTTILLVSHEITRIAQMANRHIIIDRSLTECTSATHAAPFRHP